MRDSNYPSDLSDEQCALVEPLIPVYTGGRPRVHSMRDVFDAIFYISKTGCQWRYLPKDFPPKSTVWGYFDEWRHNGTLERIEQTLRDQVRDQAGRNPDPMSGYIDSQSVPTSEGREDRGYDNYKKVQGRKRHIAVDSLGLLLAVIVTAASCDDGTTAPQVLEFLTEEEFPRLKQVWGDNKYFNHALAKWSEEHSHFQVKVVWRDEDQKGFCLLPKRWVVERTFGWLKRYRRLSLDREKTVRSSQAMIRLAMIHISLNRLAPKQQESEYQYRMAA